MINTTLAISLLQNYGLHSFKLASVLRLSRFPTYEAWPEFNQIPLLTTIQSILRYDIIGKINSYQ